MRLWHKDLVRYLPQQQLVSQWRECLAIKGAIEKNGIPNHRLVNKVMDYPLQSFKNYTTMVYCEMINRNYRPSKQKYNEFMAWNCDLFNEDNEELEYESWHNNRYMVQNFYNLDEKHDTGIINDEEWKDICDGYVKYL